MKETFDYIKNEQKIKDESNVYNLTVPQMNIWNTEMFYSGTAINNICGYINLDEKVDFKLLEKTANEFVEHTEVMNFHFKVEDGNPVQYVSDFRSFFVETKNVKDINEVNELASELARKPFELIDSDLFKFVIFKFPDGKGGMIGVFHHLICDAWAMSLLINRLIEIYTKLKNKNEEIEEYPKYTTYIKNNQEYLNGDKYKKDQEFWKEEFSKLPEITYISNKKIQENSSAKRREFEIDKNTYKDIEEYCKENKISMYTFFMGVYAIYLANINNTNGAIMGTPVLNRSNFEEKQMSGMFVSTIPFKIDVNFEEDFNDFIKEVATKQLKVYRHQKYPFSEIQKELKKQYNFNEELFDIAVSYQNARDDSNESEVKYSSKWLPTENIGQSLEVHFYDMDASGKSSIYYNYQTAKFTKKEIEKLHNRIMHIAKQAIENKKIYQIEIITDEDKKIIDKFNQSEFKYDKEKTLIDLFEEQVEKNRDKTAIVFNNKKITYDELDKKSNQVANFILSKKVNKNDVIGIMLNRSEKLMIAALGVLKAGAAYMFIDPNLPKDRIKYMLENAKSKFIISDLFFDYEKYSIEMTNTYSTERIKIESSNEDRFCVIYTSGSTGTPKGVELKRLGIINLVNGFNETLNAKKSKVFLSSSTISFDMFLAENFIAILSGKCVALANEDEQKIPAFTAKLVKEQKVDFIISTPSKIDILANEEDSLKDVKVILLGGEVLKNNVYEKLKANTDAIIYNSYGPSECTCTSSNKEVTNVNENTIGKPFINAKIHIRNKFNNIMPIGITGEMVVSGDNVGLGYINKKKFNGEYHTGDNAYLSENGELVYVGRQDNQIKFHGLRIELDEITKKLAEIKEIDNAVTVIKKVNNIESICSYVVLKEENSIDEKSIKRKLASSLPIYMVPAHIVFMPKLMITPNGKIDTKALPEIKIKELEFIEAKTATEKYLVEVWKKILKIEKISINNDFFEIGGDSLCSIQLLSEIYTKYSIKLDIKDIFDYSTISELAKFIDKKIEKNQVEIVEEKIEKHKKQDYYPVSSAQRRIYYTANMEQDSLAYNTPFGIEFNGMPERRKIENILNKIINNHESFRTYFVLRNNDVVQKVAERIDFKLKENSYNNDEFIKPFELDKAPLLHAEINYFDNKAILKLDFHHIICDGVSIAVFAKEFADLYNGEEIQKEELDYIDFAINEKIDNKDKKYWLEKYNDNIPLLNMPTSYERTNVKSEEGENIYEELLNYDEINNYCRKLKITPYMFLLSAYYILLYKYTMQNDIIVGSPVVGRNNVAFSNTIGMFVNTLALRQEVQSSLTFGEFVKQVKENCLTSFEHQTYPFDELIKNINIPRYNNRSPLFDVMFIYENNGLPELNLNDMDVEYTIPNSRTSKFDFSLEVTPAKDRYKLRLEYCTKLFKKNFMSELMNCYLNVIKNVLNNENIQISKIQMLSEVPVMWPKMDYPRDKRIIDLFEEQVKIRPNEIALVADNGTYTYKQLEEKVNRLANYICSFGNSKVIGLMLNRNAELIISMLAILKSGAGYLPLDPSYPKDRIKYIVNDSDLQIVLTQKEYKNRFSDIKTILVDEEAAYKEYKKFDTDKKMNDIAYMIYTSGSTGNPKGVMVSERNTVNFIFGVRKIMPMDRKTIVSITTMCFDIFAIETIVPLTTGMKVVLANNEEQNNPILLNKLCLKNKVEMIQTTPSKFKFLISDKDSLEYIRKMKIIELAGEPFPKILLEEIKKITKSEVFNLYGPSETTIGSTVKRLTNSTKITIGKPVANTQILVLDNDMMPVPVNVPGRLFIGGDGVSLGYINKPEKTASVFINYNGNRVYDTGDLAKILPNGELEGLGRTDFQVKIRGLRIELGEIENQINKYKNVINSVVAVKNINGRDILCGYFKAEGRISVSNLKAEISKKLPNYMVPTYLIQLSDFEYTPNGKIDRKQLPIPKIEKKEIIKPKTSTEKKLYRIWKNILGIEQISIDDNFFDIGGDSLCALKMQLELMKININVNYGDIFTYNTIQELADFIVNGNTKNVLNEYKQSDFKNVNKVLRNNTTSKISKIQRKDFKNVLLIGATGYLGIHVLSELLKKDDVKIYCIVRADLSTSSENKLKNKFKYYFGSDLNYLFGNRIFVLNGNVGGAQSKADNEKFFGG